MTPVVPITKVDASIEIERLLGMPKVQEETVVSPTKVSRKERVFQALKPRQWIAGYELTDPSVGGSEGLRRLREIRADGYEIKMRPIEGSSAFEYRLVGKSVNG